MNIEMIIALSRRTLEEVLVVSAPMLVVGVVTSLVLSILQVMTSVQDVSISTVPKLAAVGLAMFLSLPWMLRHLISFTTQLFADFHPFIK